MGTSVITALQELVIETVKRTARGEWKVFITDDGTKKLLDNVVRESDILQENVTNIELIDEKNRPIDPDLDAIYIVAPEPYVVECLMADMGSGRYRRFHLIWTSYLVPELQKKIDQVPNVRSLIANFRILNIDFYPKESHLITFRDPYSFPILFHPDCNSLVRKHMDQLAQKIISVCTTLGEYPVIRYYRPKDPLHEAGVLCTHLARFVQEGLDQFAAANQDFPPRSNRPRGVLLITDRTMDVYAPLIHEFTYQAMVHELLPLLDGDKTIYRTYVNKGRPNEEVKDMELGERDRIWTDNRHLHMKDLLEKLVAEFNKFRADNPQFADESTDQPGTLNNIKDMLAGLPQFQEGKDLYSLHLGMTQECMNIFQSCKLPDIATAEQSMATGQDEDGKKPRNLSDQVVRLLDDDSVTPVDRLRLIMQYIMHRDGIFPEDLEKLLAHAQLPNSEGEMIQNLEMLGVKTGRQIKETRPGTRPLFPPKTPTTPKPQEEQSISRYEPTLKEMIAEHLRGTLDREIFPYTKPNLDESDAHENQVQTASSSLRSAKPTWARKGTSHSGPRQRIIVFVAGGATYAESRVCYEISQHNNKDVYMATSHMTTPRLFLKQLSDLGANRRQLDLPVDRPARKAPSYALAPPQAPGPPPPPVAPVGGMALVGGMAPAGGMVPAGGMAPPTIQMGAMTMNSTDPRMGRMGSNSTNPRPSRGRNPASSDSRNGLMPMAPQHPSPVPPLSPGAGMAGMAPPLRSPGPKLSPGHRIQPVAPAMAQGAEKDGKSKKRFFKF